MSVAHKQAAGTRVHTIHVATDFTRSPGGRSPRNGAFNGVEFRTRLLEPALREVPGTYDRVVVDLDGVDTYIGSFLEEVFGGLLRGFYRTADEATERLEIRATGEFETFRDLALRYIHEQEARNRAGR